MDWAYWVYCQLFYCKRAVMKWCCPEAERKRKVINPPWFWIGAYNDNGVISVTEIVNNSLTDGCLVDISYLESTTGFKDVQWKYIDIITLEEKEFPSTGIVIEDDTKSE